MMAASCGIKLTLVSYLDAQLWIGRCRCFFRCADINTSDPTRFLTMKGCNRP